MDNIQDKIVELMKNKYKEIGKNLYRGAWNKFIGDYFVRIIKYYITKEIPNAFKLTEPNAYVSGIPIEYDLLIVDMNAKPELYTNSFSAREVLLGFELKAHGIFGGKEELRRSIQKIKGGFDMVKRTHGQINIIYLTYKEVTNPVKESSINYLIETRKYLSPYKVFCLSDSRRGVIIPGQWEKFIREINRLCSVWPGAYKIQ